MKHRKTHYFGLLVDSFSFYFSLPVLLAQSFETNQREVLDAILFIWRKMLRDKAQKMCSSLFW